MIVHTTINNRTATVAYLHSADWSFATEDTADLVKVIFDDDGEVLFLIPAAKATTDKGEWREELHPRGQPENAGEFTSGAGGGGAGASEASTGAPAAAPAAPGAPKPKQLKPGDRGKRIHAGAGDPPEVPLAAEQEAPKPKISGTNEAAHPAKISPSVTSTNRKIADSENEYVPASVEQMAKTNTKGLTSFVKNANLFRDPENYPMLLPDEVAPLPREKGEEKAAYEMRDAHHVVRAVIDRIKEDMRFLIDQATDAQLGAIHWYRGAHNMIRQRAEHYGLHPAAVAGVFAALSPTKDWDENVYIANSMLDIFHTKQKTAWNADMDLAANAIWPAKDQGAIAIIKTQTIEQIVAGPASISLPIAGKKNPAKYSKEELVGMWIRTYEQTYGDPLQPLETDPVISGKKIPGLQGKLHQRGYRAFNPNGTLGAFRVTQAGVPAKVSQQSITAMGDAVEAMLSGGDRNILSQAMGGVHKVRNFYNNLIDPEGTDGDVTIDTHAIGAAFVHYKPGTAVGQGLATSPKVEPDGWTPAFDNNGTGSFGTYGIIADAYRELAEEEDLLPNELQALVWIIKKDAFDDMGDVGAAEVDAAWEAFNAGNGKVTLEQTHKALWAASVKDRTRKADAVKERDRLKQQRAAKAAAKAAKVGGEEE